MEKTVVHLSSVLSVNLSAAFSAFTEIEKASMPFRPNPGCFNLNSSLIAKTRIMTKYNSARTQQLINEYKLGKISTQNFLESMLNNFPGLEDAIQSRLEKKTSNELSPLLSNDFISKKISEIQENRENYYVFKSGIESTISKHSLALAIIEDAFNQLITMTPKNAADLTKLINEAKASDSTILFFANTNPLNLHRACLLMKENGVTLIEKNNLEKANQNELITLNADSAISIATSYSFETFSLIEPLFNGQLVDATDHFVSPYKQDLEKVKRQIGVESQTLIQRSNDYFNSEPSRKSRCCW